MEPDWRLAGRAFGTDGDAVSFLPSVQPWCAVAESLSAGCRRRLFLRYSAANTSLRRH
jgi:hypothetical protein